MVLVVAAVVEVAAVVIVGFKTRPGSRRRTGTGTLAGWSFARDPARVAHDQHLCTTPAPPHAPSAHLRPGGEYTNAGPEGWTWGPWRAKGKTLEPRELLLVGQKGFGKGGKGKDGKGKDGKGPDNADTDTNTDANTNAPYLVPCV